MSRYGTTTIICAVFLLTALSGCLGDEGDAPKGQTTVSDSARGADIEEFSFEPVKISASASVVKEERTRQTGTLCDYLESECNDSTDWKFNWTIEDLPDLSNSEGGVSSVFYQVWLGETNGEEVNWFAQTPVPGKDGKIEGATDFEGKYETYDHFRLSLETKQDGEAEVILFEASDIQADTPVSPDFTRPFEGAFGTAELMEGVKDGQKNVTATAIGLPPTPASYDAWLQTGNDVSRLGRLIVDPASGGLAITATVSESEIANEWRVFISYEPQADDDEPSLLTVLKSRFAS